VKQTQKHNAEIQPTDTPERFAAAVNRAAALLRAGEVVALPTETVYGLAANALDARAVGRIFEAKNRPAYNPIIVHVEGLAMARKCVAQWPELASRLAEAFWPGPLTLVLRRAGEIPDVVTAGGETVGVRWPSHPFMQAVMRECDFPLAAPSANLANRVSPTSAGHVQAQLGDRIPLIIDGGQCQVGIESTVLELSVSPPRLLRPGIIHEQALIAVTGQLAQGLDRGERVLKSPGMLRKHYAPRARLVVWSWKDERQLRAQVRRYRMAFSRTCIVAHTNVPSAEGFADVSVVPHDAAAFARALYAELNRCDEAGAQWIIVEAVPEKDEWSAVVDRLTRAAANK
jgi:L-threonylcarbamoyladenylate synthase